MSEDETKAAIDAIVAETGAASVKDMGRVMACSRSATHRAGHGQGERPGEGAALDEAEVCPQPRNSSTSCALEPCPP